MIAPSERLSQLDTMALSLLFEHECNKRKVSDIIDSCKNVFHNKLKDSIIPMTNIIENNQEDQSFTNEATNEGFIDKSNQKIENSESLRNNSGSDETNIKDDDDLSDEEKDSKEIVPTEFTRSNNDENQSRYLNVDDKKNKAKLLSLNSFKINENNNRNNTNYFDQKKDRLKLLTRNSFKIIKDKKNVESIHN